MNLGSREEFKAFLCTARQFFEILSGRSHQEPERLDEDIFSLLERFEDETIYTRLIAEVYTVEDLLEDEDDSLYYPSEDEGSDDRLSLEDFEIFEDEEESEDENLDLNEVRRLHRFEQSSLDFDDL